MLRHAIPLAACLAIGLAAPAQAAFQSAYTDIDLNQCLVLASDDFQTSWACPGYRGYPLKLTEADLRFLVEYGFNIDAEPIGGQTLPPFNHLGPRMEWRVSNASGRYLPVATIVRYFTDVPETPGDPNEVLVVTQIEAGNTCHIAYVDALANADANTLAREAADRLAGTIDCTDSEPEIIGDFEAF